MVRIFVLCLFMFLISCGIAEELFERVKRAQGRNCPRFSNFNGRVKYRRRGTRAVFKCGKSFTRYGNKAVNCRSDNTWTGEPPVCIKANCVPKDIRHLEKLDMTEMYGGALLSFSCEDNYKLIGITEIYCNGKVWNADPPVCKAPKQLLECDFEDDLCGWSQDESEDLDWIRNQGQTSTGGTGPRTDHTLQTSAGHYMFVESSNPAKVGDEARLVSPLYPTDMGNMCFEFWYHILGPDDEGHVGTLEVYVIGESKFLDDLQPVFMKEGNQGDEWRRGEIYIDKRDEPYQIVIATVRKLSYISDIAVDDVKLYNCSDLTTTSLSQSTSKATTILVPTIRSSSRKSLKTQSTVPPETPILTASSAGTSIKPTPSPSPVTSTSSAKTTMRTENPIPSTSLSKDNSSVAATFTETMKSTTKTQTTVESTPKSSTLPTTSLSQTTKVSTTPQTSASKSTSVLLPTTAIASTTTQISSTSTIIPTTNKRLTTTSMLLKTSTSIQTTTSQQTTITSTLTSTTSKTSTTKSSSVYPATSSLTKTSTMVASSKRTKPTKIPTKAKSTIKVKPTKPSAKSAKPTKRPTTKVLSTKSTTKMTTKGLISTSLVSMGKSETTGSGVISPTTKNNNTEIKISIAEQRAQHPDDETLKPLMIGLGVGIFCGLIIIGVVAWVCVRRKKFYTRGYEDELKPITKSSSNDNFTGIQYEYHDDEYEQ